MSVVNAVFAAARSRSISASTATEASVGRKSAPPATSPAPLPTSPDSQIRFI